MGRGFAGALIVLGMGLPAPAAGEPGTATVAAGLQGWLDQTRTLEGSFEQTLLSGALGTGLTERGRIWLERPGRLRWDYTDPDPKIAIVVEGATALYLPQDRQLIRGRLGDEQAALPELLASRGRLTDLFDVGSAPSAANDPRGSVRLRLVPQRGTGAVEEVVLLLGGRAFEILGADVLDAAGNRMTYRFTHWRRNRPLEPGLFAFEPPPGTEILRQD